MINLVLIGNHLLKASCNLLPLGLHLTSSKHSLIIKKLSTKSLFSIIEKILGDKIFNQSNQKFRELWTLAKEQLNKNNKNQNDKK